MKTYPHYYSLVEQAISDLSIAGEPKELYDPVKYMLSLGGKRLRPVLVLMANELFGGKEQDALPAALAVEVFHNFTLVHDDIMDKAFLRRGKPTVHAKWNETVAILSGDLMMIKATDILCEAVTSDLKSLILQFNKSAIEVCEGQQLDMNYETREDVSTDEYLGMITLKTAVLLGCSLKLGAMIAGASPSACEHIYEFGKNIGIAFQIQDDILDAFGDESMTGKKVGGDIASNKKTLLLIEALSLADEETKRRLHDLLGMKAEQEDKVSGMLAVFNQLMVKEKAEALKERYLQQAFIHLQTIEVNESDKEVLKDTAKELMQRIS